MLADALDRLRDATVRRLGLCSLPYFPGAVGILGTPQLHIFRCLTHYVVSDEFLDQFDCGLAVDPFDNIRNGLVVRN